MKLCPWCRGRKDSVQRGNSKNGRWYSDGFICQTCGIRWMDGKIWKLQGIGERRVEIPDGCLIVMGDCNIAGTM